MGNERKAVETAEQLMSMALSKRRHWAHVVHGQSVAQAQALRVSPQHTTNHATRGIRDVEPPPVVWFHPLDTPEDWVKLDQLWQGPKVIVGPDSPEYHSIRLRESYGIYPDTLVPCPQHRVVRQGLAQETFGLKKEGPAVDAPRPGEPVGPVIRGTTRDLVDFLKRK